MEITSDAFFHRLASAGKIGFGEAYMAEEWRADDLAGVLAAFASRLTSLVPRPMQLVRRLYEPLQPGDERNTTEGARANISRHYDLSNDLFALFLDATMTYSCAIFRPGDSLEQAQLRKYQAMCDLVDLRPDDHLLEIGTGWGGMAMYAAAGSGCRVTTITISERQKQLAERRIRDVRGRFDKIVSIEMFEAVGEEYWAEFFGICDGLLAPGGRMGLQTITMPHNRFRASRRSYTWVHKYIFPGGLIPSEPAIADALQRGSRLRVAFTDEIGDHYARTLRIWRERFLERWDDVRELGFDDTFRRTWEFYLAYCEAGFRTGAIGDVQMALQKQ
jgi:cyclopropane-fatty-acyl-phospholipid synthase